MKKVLLGLTTTPGSDWREKIRETEKFGIEEVALFSTFLTIEDRKELYELIKSSPVKSMPHVHLREDDTQEWELEMLEREYGTKVFNIHPVMDHERFDRVFKKFKEKVYIENLYDINDAFYESMAKAVGICLDFCHWKDGEQFKWPGYEFFREFALTHAAGCCHVSSFKKEPSTSVFVPWGYEEEMEIETQHNHIMEDISEIEYVKDYIGFMPGLVSIELENSFEEQLGVKKYLEKII